MTAKIAFAAPLLALAAGCGSAPAPRSETADGVFVHISKGPAAPHAVLMGLAMANLMRESGREVLVYFDVDGIGAVSKDAPDLTFAHFEASRAQIAKLAAAGGLVRACPGCLKAAGKTAEDLMPGVRVAEKDEFFDFTKGRILTLDY